MAFVTPAPRRLRLRISAWFREYRSRFWDWLLDFALRNHPAARGSNIVAYAESELLLAGWYDEDAFYGDLVPNAVLRSARLFSIEGHSGMSAGLVNNLTSHVVMFRPLTPLTGESQEWQEIGEDMFQNTRMSSIFKKGENGHAYRIDGRVFEEPSGARYTNKDSRVPVDFPWEYREPEIVKVGADA